MLSTSRKRPAPSTNTLYRTESTQSQPSNELKRLYPDPSDVIKALTRWIPPEAVEVDRVVVMFRGVIGTRETKNDGDEGIDDGVNGGGGEGVNGEDLNPMIHPSEKCTRDGSKEFGKTDGLLRAYSYPLLTEGLCALNGEYHSDKLGDGRWNKQTYNLRVTTLTEVTPVFRSKSYFTEPMKMYEIQFAKETGKTPPKSLSELYAIHFPSWPSTKFGFVAHDVPTAKSFSKLPWENNASLKLWVCVVEDEDHARDTGWISRNEFMELLHPTDDNPLQVKDETKMNLISVGSTINIVRQFEAIKSLPHLKPHLQKAIFTSQVTVKPKEEGNTTRPASVPMDIWQKLKRKKNVYQLQSISDLMNGVCLENFSLIQGPPGTGKSSTIAGLVSALLSGKVSLPGAKRSSATVIHPGKTLGTKVKETEVRNRILVCATTNQAVDSLAWKIKNESVGTSGKVGDFQMVRFGNLPWDVRGGNTPKVMSEMERFLYDINSETKVADKYKANANEESDEEEGLESQRKKRRVPFRCGARLRSDIISGSNIVLATLSGAGSKAFIDAVRKNDNKFNSEFRAVIIDEACQSSEPESLIPFKFNPTTVTLVGDPQQLPVLTLSTNTKYDIYQRSLFERLQNLDWPTILLREQYRMHDSIAAFPSQEFYQGQLMTPDIVKKRPAQVWESNPCFKTLAFWDSNGSTMARIGNALANKEEADFIIKVMLTTFAEQYLTRQSAKITIGIISFYREQVRMLQNAVDSVQALHNNSKLNVKVATVDGFQGSECDIIVLSCVRSHTEKEAQSAETDGEKTHSGVGFLKDCRRANVALTRARCSLWIVGNAEVLKTSPLWQRLVTQLEEQGVVSAMGDFRKMLSEWKGSRE